MTAHTSRFLIAALMGFGLFAPWTAVNAETVTKDTYITQQEIPDTRKVNFSEFDRNKDGILSRLEVGEELFYIFDTDGNEVVDNIEYNRNMVLTIIPMEKKEITSVDFNDDGVADSTDYDHQAFLESSKLIAFDLDKDGLSARDFLGRVYWQLDDNKDKTVDIKEFQAAYVASLQPSAANPNRYNQ